MNRARAVMVLGTASSAGKSTLVAGLCRILADAGVRVAPFKAQNMSLNSAATPDGREIGRAQAMQAEAARLAPDVDMNPVLLKPTSDRRSQAIVHGEIAGTLDASDFGGASRARFRPAILASYERLAAAYDVVVIEGAGSPAEINLREGDVVNMAMAHAADARCVLVGDIDRGGVFAALYGTLALLDERDRARFDAFAINKFRGDLDLLRPGIASLEALVRLPCLGVVPHLGAIGLDEEDGVERAPVGARWRPERADDHLRVAVVALPHLANFTDFDALAEEPSVDLRYVDDAAAVELADVVVLPGTKDTLADLAWLRARGLDAAAARAGRERQLLGICGGMQMLGRTIRDPHGIESGGEAAGIGTLDLETTFAREKTAVPVDLRAERASGLSGTRARGYEMHVGETHYGDVVPFAAIARTGETCERRDGAVANDGRVLATYVHGILACDAFRHAYVATARIRAGLPPARAFADVEADRERRFERLASAVRDALDLSQLFPELAAARA